MIKKAVIFGNLPIATKVARILRDRSVEIVGCVIGADSKRYYDPWPEVGLAEYSYNEGINLLSFDDVLTLGETIDADIIGISCRFNRIIPKNIISVFSDGIVNFHGGLLPEMGGLYSSCHTILEGQGKGGGTIHYIDEFIDNGDIILRCEFDVDEEDNSFSVFQKTQRALLKGFEQVVEDILHRKVKVRTQAELLEEGYKKGYYDKNSINLKKRLTGGESFEDMYRIVRAFDFPGHEPAYIESGNKKIYLTTQIFFNKG